MKLKDTVNAFVLVATVGVLYVPAFAVVDPNSIPQKDSANFNFKYEMNVLPTADDQGGAVGPDWTVSTSGGVVSEEPAVFGGALHYKFSNEIGHYEFNNTDTGAGISFDTGYTIEIRVQTPLDPAGFDSTPPRALAVVALPGGGHNDTLGWMSTGRDHVEWADIGDPGSGKYLGNDGAADDFHIFRYVQQPGVNEFSVWRDGVLLAITSPSSPEGATTLAGADLGLGANHPLEKIAFGKEGGNWGGEVILDYIRFDTTGAFAPVPEPASLSLAAVSAVLLLGRRNRKVN